MTKKLVKLQPWQIGLLILGVVVIAGGIFALTRPKKLVTPPASQPTAKTAKPANTSTLTKTSDTPTPSQSKLPKPTLSKSSGNNGPVPNGAMVQFICSGVINVNCSVTLTDQDRKTITLEAKPVSDDGRGQAAVSWLWEAKAGTWQIVATASATGYQSTESDPQTLKVNQ